MTTKRKPPQSASRPPAASPENVWLAGLDALAQAQARGTQTLDALMREGMAQQMKAQKAAEAELSKAAEQMAALTMGAGTAPWNRLSGIFEARVGHALARIGMPTPQALCALVDRITALEARVAKLEQQPAARGRAKPAGTARAGTTRAKRT